MVHGRCIWCGVAISRRRKRGSERKFCSSAHRASFWRAARRWALNALAAGLVTVEELKRHV